MRMIRIWIDENDQKYKVLLDWNLHHYLHEISSASQTFESADGAENSGPKEHIVEGEGTGGQQLIEL